MNVYWSNIAAADLADIFGYIARDVPYYGESFSDRYIAVTDMLDDHPRIARRTPEAGQRADISKMFVQSFRFGRSAGNLRSPCR